MKRIKKMSVNKTNVIKEAETLARLVRFEESLGDSPQDHLMKVILNSKTLRGELFNRMLRKY